jgi:hypothetical protein
MRILVEGDDARGRDNLVELLAGAIAEVEGITEGSAEGLVN